MKTWKQTPNGLQKKKKNAGAKKGTGDGPDAGSNTSIAGSGGARNAGIEPKVTKYVWQKLLSS